MTRVAVVLSGCGVYDGTEIHEAVITLLALDRAGAKVVCAAPDVPQAHVVDHQTGRPAAGEQRMVLAESARIARGAVRDLASLHAADVDAAVFPGGFGAAKNLSDWAERQAACTVHPEVARFVRELHAARKPLGFVCIAPVLAARALGEHHPRLTIGTDPVTAASVEAMGARHEPCAAVEVVVDPTNRIVSTPAYMLASRISEAATGIEKLVAAVVEMARTCT